ncbi:MAG TPA: acetyl-coenzyme A synthetase N-terminal domain-containing protein, partial [Actinomycetota bacterium]|nr:acetyl-coenzyme A synthetase N-terminal domain-containing protein [Actinomycetota bacterium]
MDSGKTIEALLEERRTFRPPEDFTAEAVFADAAVYAEAERDPKAWWASQAERLDWFERWDKVMEGGFPRHSWFTGGKLNAAHNCLDRHLESNGGRVAYHWIGEPGETRT